MKSLWKYAVFGLLMSSVRAETESGLINLTTFASGVNVVDRVVVTMKSPSSTLTGLCGANGIYLPLSGDAGRASYSALLAAVVSGKSITLIYEYNVAAGGCLLTSARIE